jgi:nucleotide-binding universal stress UspA family protein
MDSKKIIVPVDFTPASEQAIKQAILIAKKSGFSIWLAHVIGKEMSDKNLSMLSTIEDTLEALAMNVRDEGVNCRFSVVTGSIFDELPAFANNGEFSMMVIGTHGIQGIKQKLLGADILKIARKTSIPCLIVQEDCITRKFNPLVLPVGGHGGFTQLIEATAAMAEFFGAVVHIYSIIRKGEQEFERIRENTLLAERIFAERKVTCKRVKEDSNVVSVGYAKQTLQYANMIDAGLVAVMSVKSEEHYYFAQADKETMINNEFNIPILCANGLAKY